MEWFCFKEINDRHVYSHCDFGEFMVKLWEMIPLKNFRCRP